MADAQGQTQGARGGQVQGSVHEPSSTGGQAVPGSMFGPQQRTEDELEALPAIPAAPQQDHKRVSSSGSGSSFPASFPSSPRTETSASRTHVPSLTSRAFYAPMSSQRLQAHRGQRPQSQIEYRRRTSDDFEEDKSATNRNSTGSVLTTRGAGGAVVRNDVEAMPPMSRGTDYTEWTNAGRTFTPTDFDRTFTTNRRQESLEPLQQRRDSPMLPQVNGHQNTDRHPAASIPREKSPKSFMSNFKRSSRQNPNGQAIGHTNGHTNGHARLPSESSPAVKSMDEKEQGVNKNLGRNYEYFTGRTVFFLGGRWQNAKARPVVLLTGLLFILPSILFFVFSAPWLSQHVSAAIPAFFAYFFYICLSSFIHASVSNPGVLPRNLHVQQMPDPAVDPLAVQASNRWVLVKSATSQHGLFEIPTKYCSSCNIWRPPRCHHCRVCDNCVETQDHHCIWLNNCVGRRNYRYFFSFVASGSWLGLYLLGASLGHIGAWASQNHTTWTVSVNHNRVPLAMVVYGFMAAGYPLSLWGYHLFLVSRGQTTHEFLNATRFRELDRHRPFKQAHWWQDFVAVLFRPRPPTYLKFKAKYEEGDQRLGERNGHRKAPLPEQQQGGGGLEMKQLKYPTSFQGPRSRAPVDATPR